MSAPLDGKLMAAITAAIEAYEQEEHAASLRPQGGRSKWLKQARRGSIQSGASSFIRPGRWR